MIPKAITRKDILEAIRRIDTHDADVHPSLSWDIVYNGKRYPPKAVVRLAAKIATGSLLDSQEFEGGDQTNDFLRKRGFEIAPKEARVIDDNRVQPGSVRVGRVFMNLDVPQSKLYETPKDDRWDEHKRLVTRQFRKGKEAYRDRVAELARRAFTADAEVVVLPACALVHDADIAVTDYNFKNIPLVVSGAFELTRRSENAIVFRYGKVVERFTNESIRWFDNEGRFSVMAAISSTIGQLYKGEKPIRSTKNPPSRGMPVLLVDSGHHPYSDHYRRQTLRCAAREAEALVARPAAVVLSSWKYNTSQPAPSWCQPEDRITWKRLTKKDEFDIIDIVDVNLDL